MNAQNSAECSGITLRETRGLIDSLLEKLSGKKWKFWLRALKRFLRRENPFIPAQVIRTLLSTPTGKIASAISALIETNISVFFRDKYNDEELEKVLGAMQGENTRRTDLLGTDMVWVRLGDMFTLEELGALTYAKVLETADKEFNLQPCHVLEGLYALKTLILMASAARYGGTCVHYIVCTEHMTPARGDSNCVLLASINSGPYPKQEGPQSHNTQGMLALYAVDDHLKYGEQRIATSGSLLDPDTRLIFRSFND